MRAEREIRLDSLFEQDEPKLFEAGDLPLGERLVRDVGEGGSTPEREGVAQPFGGFGRPLPRKRAPRLGEQTLAAPHVQLVVREHEHVTRRLSAHPRRSQHRA